jgi:hypothetical protein
MKDKIYALIKKERGLTLDEIAAKLHIERVVAAKIIQSEIDKGFIEVVRGQIFVKNILMPPVTKVAEGIAWDFGKIQREVVEADEVMNPYNNKVAPHQQGDRGTCVGQSSSSMMDYSHYALTKEEPTGTIKRDNVEGSAIYDTLYDQSFSAESIYQWSRQEGGVTDPSGSYCNAAIRALAKKGICLEKQWRTSKSTKGTWSSPYPASQAECEAEAAKHRLEGYAAIRTLSDLKACLATRFIALGAINIYDNYMANGKVVEDGQELYDGNLPDPRGDVIGSHALVFIGYSNSKERLYFRHSWKEWTKIGSISFAYWERAGGDFWAPLDTEETIIGQKTYQSVEIDVSPAEAAASAKVSINGSPQTGSVPLTVSLEKDSSAIITVIATGYKSQTTTLTKVDESVSKINFTLEADTAPTIPLYRRILEWIKALIEKICKR